MFVHMKRSLSHNGCETGHAGCAIDVTECSTGADIGKNGPTAVDGESAAHLADKHHRQKWSTADGDLAVGPRRYLALPGYLLEQLHPSDYKTTVAQV